MYESGFLEIVSNISDQSIEHFITHCDQGKQGGIIVLQNHVHFNQKTQCKLENVSIIEFLYRIDLFKFNSFLQSQL